MKGYKYYYGFAKCRAFLRRHLAVIWERVGSRYIGGKFNFSSLITKLGLSNWIVRFWQGRLELEELIRRLERRHLISNRADWSLDNGRLSLIHI